MNSVCERSEVSRHEVLVYAALRNNPARWMSNHDIAGMVEGVSHRTVRLHTSRLSGLGLVDQAEVFPGHRFRFSEKGDKRNRAYASRIEQAAEILGIALN